MHPPQRPRPVRPGTAASRRARRGSRPPRSARRRSMVTPSTPGRSAVGTDLAPGPPEHVAAGDLVIEGMETAIPILLSTAVKHALESTNPIHAHGAADGPSRYGTHQSPSRSFPCIDEVRALPHVAGFPDLRTTTTRSDCRSTTQPFPGFAGYRRRHRFPPPRRRRGRDGSPEFPGRPSARSTPNTPEGSSAPAPGTKSAFHGLRRASNRLGTLSSPPERRVRLTTLAQASLTLRTARSHPPRFAPDLSITHGGIATRDPGISPDRTHTGRPS